MGKRKCLVFEPKKGQQYVYVLSEDACTYDADLWTVGFYKPDGKWNPESDYSDVDDARRQVHYLNGGCKKCDPTPEFPNV